MPIYRKTGHAGAAFDEVILAANSPEEGIALAGMYRCSTPGMDLSVAVLIDERGVPIWSRRMTAHDVAGPDTKR